MKDNIKHIGIIPDGGRRWARRFNVPLVEAYGRSFTRLYDLLSRAHQAGFAEASIYVLSKGNLSRSSEELTAVFQSLESLRNTLIKLSEREGGCAIKIVGNTTALPVETQGLLNSIKSTDSSGHSLKINLLTAYDPWDELIDVIHRKGSIICIEDLWVNNAVDAIIRTGGSTLLSGFLPLQSQYAHIFTTDEMFNDLSDERFDELIQQASAVLHRFGK